MLHNCHWCELTHSENVLHCCHLVVYWHHGLLGFYKLQRNHPFSCIYGTQHFLLDIFPLFHDFYRIFYISTQLHALSGSVSSHGAVCLFHYGRFCPGAGHLADLTHLFSFLSHWIKQRTDLNFSLFFVQFSGYPVVAKSLTPLQPSFEVAKIKTVWEVKLGDNAAPLLAPCDVSIKILSFINMWVLLTSKLFTVHTST